MRVYTSKLTSDSVVSYLFHGRNFFHDRERRVIVLPGACVRRSKYSTHSIVCVIGVLLFSACVHCLSD